MKLFKSSDSGSVFGRRRWVGFLLFCFLKSEATLLYHSQTGKAYFINNLV